MQKKILSLLWPKFFWRQQKGWKKEEEEGVVEEEEEEEEEEEARKREISRQGQRDKDRVWALSVKFT